MGSDRYLKLSRFLERLGYRIDLSTLESRILFQKRTYFAQLLGLDSDYSFGWYVFGPYSTELTKEAYEFQGIETLARPRDEDDVRRASSFFHEVSRLVAEEKDDRYWLELLSSLQFLATSAVPPLREMTRCLSKLMQEKPGKFSRADMQVAWDLLVRVRLLPSTG